MQRKTTIHDIAAKLNLSASSISRALQNHPRISKKTRDLVKKTAKEMNYSPNPVASNLRTGKGNSIGVIVPRINRHFFSHAIAGVETITNPAGYNLIICQTNECFETEVQSLQTLINNRVDGLLISVSTSTMRDEHIRMAINGQTPVVFFDRVLPEVKADYVVNDNIHGGYAVTQHLIEQGYRKIIHFSGPLHNKVYADRYKGYKLAMDKAGIELPADHLFEDVLTRDKGREYAQLLVENKKIPEAIFAASDYSALGALLEMKRHGLSIPEEIGIAGFANEPFTEIMEPAMTSLDQFGGLMGENAAKMLIDRIENNKDPGQVSTLSFKPELIIRDSTKKQ